MDEAGLSVAEAFVDARRNARTIACYPGEAPTDLASAYRIQGHAIRIAGRSVAGWKVGRIFPPDDVRLGTNRLSGPIFADSVVAAVPEPVMPVFAGGFAAAEAELLLHIVAGFAGPVPHDDAGTRAIVDDIRLGIEIASSPYARINSDGPAVTASDFGNNHGLVMGPALTGWAALDLCAIEVTTTIDGGEVGRGTAAAMLDGPYGAVRFLLAHLGERGIDVAGGLWVSTGAITGVHPVRPGQHVAARFGDHGALSCRISAAT